MHPASSVIFFTVFSGIGYGLMALLGLSAAAGWLPRDPDLGAAGLGSAAAAVTLGLLSSTLHLGRPERALRAFSQWRTSWLSREGMAAVATYVPLTALAWLWIAGSTTEAFGIFCLLTAVMALVTVYCTAMIYRTLRPVPEWATPYTVAGYLLLGVSGGAVWLAAIARIFDAVSVRFVILALVALAIAWCVKTAHWRFIDTRTASTSAGSATGLGHMGRVRMLEGPHTEANFLLREMGYRVARRHAAKLRRYAQALAFLIPALLIAASAATPANGAGILAVAAGVLATAGQLIERWLFFAEARHVVTLYYGMSAEQ